jgi:peroxiredoxin
MILQPGLEGILEPVLHTGNPAPNFSLNDLEGRPRRLSDLRGKIVALYFWSADCAWCRRVDELLGKLASDWDGRVVLLAISANQEENHEMLLREAKARGIWPVLQDADQEIARVYGAFTTPHFFLLDAGGVLRYQGAFDNVSFRQRTATSHFVADALEALLEGRSPNPSETTPYGCALTIF